MSVSKSNEKIDFILQLLENQKAFQEAMNVSWPIWKSKWHFELGLEIPQQVVLPFNPLLWPLWN